MRTVKYYDTDSPETWTKRDLKHEVNALGFVYDEYRVGQVSPWIDIRSSSQVLICRIYKHYSVPHFTIYEYDDLNMIEKENIKDLVKLIRRYMKGRVKENDNESIE